MLLVVLDCGFWRFYDHGQNNLFGLGCREVAILQDLRDSNIVQFLGACLTVEKPLLVTEFMQGGDLYDAINRDRNGVLLWYKRYIFSCPTSYVLPTTKAHFSVACSFWSTAGVDESDASFCILRGPH